MPQLGCSAVFCSTSKLSITSKEHSDNVACLQLQLLAAGAQPLSMEEVVAHVQGMRRPSSDRQQSPDHLSNVVKTTLSQAVSAAREQPLKEASECQFLPDSRELIYSAHHETYTCTHLMYHFSCGSSAF